jgi:hypothetical protein
VKNEEKKKYIDLLRKNEEFLSVLKFAEKEEEKEKIRAFSEDIFLQLIEGFSLIAKTAQENPEKFAEAAEAYIGNKKKQT